MESLLKFKIRSLLKPHSLYLYIQNFVPKKKDLVVQRITEVVIEGFPRSANSWACHIFQYLSEKENNKRLILASHLHAASQIKRALKLEVPAILLIRNPIDAVASLILMNPNLTINSVLNDYIRMYKSLMPYKDKIQVVSFTDLIKNPNDIISEFSYRFGIKYSYELKKDDINEITNQIKNADHKTQGDKYTSYHIPTEKKNEEKEQLIERIKLHSNKLTEANKIYKYYTN
ncbi:MAG: hypothetical protein MI922_05235 [Bacteroidales bacterium]|nr:hypothetical protein [Bacteroidales bacterium]